MLHGTDEQLELYTRRKLSESEVVHLEEHLLTCPSCVERLDEVFQFGQAIRTAILEDPKPASKPMFYAWAAAAVLLLATGLWLFERPSALPPIAALQLTALRGGIPSTGPAQEFDLVLTDAPKDAKLLRIQVVNAAGVEEWSEGGSVAKVRKSLEKGTHFVRLYDPQGQMLHEYGFQIR